MTEPSEPGVTSLAEPPEDRNPQAWTMLYILFALLITLAVAGYAASGVSLKDRLGATETSVLERVTNRANFEFLGSDSSHTKLEVGAAVGKARRDFLDWKGGPESKLAPLQEAEKLYVAITFESSGKVPKPDLESLSRVGDPAFMRIYDSPKLLAQMSKVLASELPDEPAVEILAKAHAYKKAGISKPYLAAVTAPKVRFRIGALGVVGLLTIAGIALWIIFMSLTTTGYLRPLGHPALPMSLARSDRFALRGFQLLTGFIVVEILGSLPPVRAAIGEGTGEALMTLGIVLFLIALSRVPIDGRRITLASIGWSKEKMGRHVLWGLGGAVANVPLLFLLATISAAALQWLPTHPHPITTELTQSRDFATVFLVSITAAVGAPIFEESVFRGILFPAMSARFKSAVGGAIVSSLLFAALHPTGPPTWLPLAGIALVSACLSYYTRSLIPSVVMHAAHNLATLILALALS